MKVEQDVADTLEGDVERLQILKTCSTTPSPSCGVKVTLQIRRVTGQHQLSFSVAADARRAHGSRSLDAGKVAVAKFMVAA